MALPRFGVNYVPRTNWWYSWVDWDDRAIAEDLRAIRGLGLDHIRIQCLWPLFQPNPALVSPLLLSRLDRLLDLAEQSGLEVVITVLDGWLSGFDFRPSWIEPGVDIFSDRAVIEAQKLLIRRIVETAEVHGAFLGIDVANEPSVLSDTANITTPADADAWVGELLAYCREIAPTKMNCVGMDHRPWLTEITPFGRDTLANTGDVLPVHAWIYFTGALERYGETGTGTIHLAEFMLELARAYSRDPAQSLWLQEYGAAPEWLDDLAVDDFLDLATRAALQVDNLWGITWWASHDVDRSLGAFAELEYDLGLFTVDNEVKPAGARLRALIAEIQGAGSVEMPERATAIVLPDEATPDLAFADAFFTLIDEGIHPAIVLESRRSDAAYLSARGIRSLIDREAVNREG